MSKKINSSVVVRRVGIRGGKPLIKDSRITVEDVLDHLALGWSVPQLKRLFTSIKIEYVEQLLRDISKDYAKKR